MSETPTEATPTPAPDDPQPPADAVVPTGSAAYIYEVAQHDDDAIKVIGTFTYAPEKVSDVEAVRLVRGIPLADSIVVRAAGHVLFATDVARETGDLHLDRYGLNDDGAAVGEPISHPIRLV